MQDEIFGFRSTATTATASPVHDLLTSGMVKALNATS